MPTYEYRCPQGHTFERFQKITDPPGADCPSCGAPAERVISGGAGLVFKGSGFYITDYKRAGEKRTDEKPTDKGTDKKEKKKESGKPKPNASDKPGKGPSAP